MLLREKKGQAKSEKQHATAREHAKELFVVESDARLFSTPNIKRDEEKTSYQLLSELFPCLHS